jgi:DnaJ-class molecular chaperone
MSFHERKDARREHYLKWVFGWKLRDCGACSGSGRYDHNGSPKCGACGGTGRERYKPEKLGRNLAQRGIQ